MPRSTPSPRQAYRAARAVETLPARISALQDRQTAARATLAGILGPQDEATVPGYIVRRTPEGLVVIHTPNTLPDGWQQLALDE